MRLYQLNSVGMCEGDFEETFDIRVVPAPGERFNRVALSAKIVKQAADPTLECEKPAKKAVMNFRTTYRWDAKSGEFKDMTKGLDGFSKWNESRY